MNAEMRVAVGQCWWWFKLLCWKRWSRTIAPVLLTVGETGAIIVHGYRATWSQHSFS